MARMNHQDRSLKIIARQNGWDPDEIVGDAYTRAEDRIKVGDLRTIPASMQAAGASAASNANGSISMVKPESIPDSPLKSHKTTNADPMAGKG